MRADRRRSSHNDPRTHSVGVLEDYARRIARQSTVAGGLHDAVATQMRRSICSFALEHLGSPLGQPCDAPAQAQLARRRPRCFVGLAEDLDAAVPLGVPVATTAPTRHYARRCDYRGAARRAGGGESGGAPAFLSLGINQTCWKVRRVRCARSCASRPPGPTRGSTLRGGSSGGALTPPPPRRACGSMRRRRADGYSGAKPRKIGTLLGSAGGGEGSR